MYYVFEKIVQSYSLARGPILLFMYTVEQLGFLVRKYWQTGSFKACQTAFQTEFGERNIIIIIIIIITYNNKNIINSLQKMNLCINLVNYTEIRSQQNIMRGTVS